MYKSLDGKLDDVGAFFGSCQAILSVSDSHLGGVKFFLLFFEHSLVWRTASSTILLKRVAFFFLQCVANLQAAYILLLWRDCDGLSNVDVLCLCFLVLPCVGIRSNRDFNKMASELRSKWYLALSWITRHTHNTTRRPWANSKFDKSGPYDSDLV